MAIRTSTFTFRLRPETRELLESWAAHWDTTPARVIERLLVRSQPPEKAGEAEARVRRAHDALVKARGADVAG